ncbi:MAG: DEAD/DEAH box helicase [Pseudomonadota bacterium]
MQKKETKKTKKSSNRKNIGQGWLTTDADEIQRRYQRALKEDMSVSHVISPDGINLHNYQVTSANKNAYFVELRSKTQRINSCDCPDYQMNGLGSCKHIEKAILFHNKKKLKSLAFADIYLDRRINQTNKPTICILWSEQIDKQSALYQLINSLFSNNNELLSNPLDGIASIERIILNKGFSIEQVRISSHISPYLERLQFEKNKQTSRSAYLSDVAEGKRSIDFLKYDLYNYQQLGMYHLAFSGRAILADEMGLGKTVQAIAAAILLAKIRGVKRVMVVSPVSLKTEWEEQINKFTDLSSLIIQGNRKERLALYQQDKHFFYLTNYEQIRYDKDEIQQVLAPDLIILDEAQRIKNWQTQTAQVVKQLKSPFMFVLTGTPIENRIDEIYSLAQALDPHIFGPLFRFNREFYQLDEKGRPEGYKNIHQLHQRLKPILLRRRKGDIADQLPERTVNTFFVEMHPEQEQRYDEYSSVVARIMQKAKRRPLSPDEFQSLQINLACMRMLCDTPYILDQECKISPKLDELKKILEELLEDPENKIIIFSEWTKMLDLVTEHLDQQSTDYVLHTGKVKQQKRRELINRFKTDPACRLFISSDAGATGLNLQAANVVINLDLPWNPAKLEQRIARAWRKHQKRHVSVINMVCENSIEHRILHLLDQKSSLADSVLDGGGAETMDLPSGRKVLIERLGSLIDTEVVVADETSGYQDLSKTEAKTQDINNIAQDVQAHYPDNLIQMDVFENQGKKTLFSVVSSQPEKLDSLVKKTVYKENYQLDQVETIDQKTLLQIQKLVDAGILSFNDPSQNIFQTEKKIPQQASQNSVWIKKAREKFSKADYQLKMAEVLFNGNFINETKSPLTRALEITLSCLYLAVTGKNKENIASIQIEQILIPKTDLDDEIIFMAETIRDENTLLSKELFFDLVKIIKHSEEILDKMVMNS